MGYMQTRTHMAQVPKKNALGGKSFFSQKQFVWGILLMIKITASCTSGKQRQKKKKKKNKILDIMTVTLSLLLWRSWARCCCLFIYLGILSSRSSYRGPWWVEKAQLWIRPISSQADYSVPLASCRKKEMASKVNWHWGREYWLGFWPRVMACAGV